MKELRKTYDKCEHCKKEKATCLIGVYKHSSYVKTQHLCKDCFEYSMAGGVT